jgi:hypothetical protein
MSFLVDPPTLFADGEAYGRLMPESAQGGAARAIGGATVAAFMAYGAGAYLNEPWTKWLWEPLGAKSGRDLMLGWPLAHGSRRRRRTPRTDAVAVAVLATYPLWWWLGWDHGRRARPRGSA